MSRDEVRRLFYRLRSAHSEEIENFETAVEHMRGGAQSRFHDAARRAEYRSAARRHGERVVEFLVGKLGKLDTRGLDHPSQFTRRQSRVDVVFHLLARTLVFFRGTRYNAYHIKILRVDAVLFAPIAFEQSAEHLLRRLARGEMRYHLGIRLLDELDPSGAARGKHRQRLVGLDTVYQLARLFHYRKVGGDVHIEHRVRAEPSDGGDHFAFHVRTHGHIERFAQSRPYGRSGKEHHLLGRI